MSANGARRRHGSDTIDGGAGWDIVYYDEFIASGVTVNLTTNRATDNYGFMDTLLGIEDAFGSRYSDQLTGNGLGNILFGYLGSDVLSGEGGDNLLLGDQVRYENGFIEFSPGGDDVIRGGAGNDIMAGGSGVDTADYSTAAAGVTVDLYTAYACADGDGDRTSSTSPRT